MIDYNKRFEIMNTEYENLVQEYYEFKTKQNQTNRNRLLKQIKIFNTVKNKFCLSVTNLYIGGKNK